MSTLPVAEAVGGDRYAFLTGRAAAFVRERGGAVQEDVLVAHVFGNSGTAALWRPLLKRLLEGEEELAWRPDGFWTLRDAPPSADAPLLSEFVALDVETTGLKPLRQRVIEIAAVRFRDGVEVGRYETLLNPDKRIPRVVVDLTGITDGHVADAPRFPEVAEELVQFLGPSLLVGHNVRFDLGFLDAELKRVGRPPLTNERVDTLGLATRLLPGLRRPNLDKVALALGLNPRHVHRAGVDAQLTGEVALKLLEYARDAGWETLDRIKALANSTEVRSQSRAGRGRETLDRSLLADIPRLPGVYLMRDTFENVVYVGKAKNLRERVGSYFSQALGYTRKMDGLVEHLARIDVEVTGSELEALLLEAQLIRRYQPRYNTALRSFEHYPYIRVDIANPWPRVTLARDRKNDGALYFGPFRNKTGARKTVDLVNGVVPLRTCPRSFKDARSYGSPCIQLDLGRCLGPCVGRANRDAYLGLVREVVQFLDGRDEVLYERLWAGLEDAAARLDFERARKLRDDLKQVTHVVQAHRRLREAAETHNLLLVLPSADPACREVLLVVGGRVWAQVRAGRADPDALSERLAGSWARYRTVGLRALDQDSVDDTNILNRWLYANAGHPSVVSYEPAEEIDWTDLAGQALGLTEADLTTDVQAGVETDIDLPLDQGLAEVPGNAGVQEG